MSRQSFKLLFSKTDTEQLSPILEALKKKGASMSEGKADRGDFLLAALSENFFADEDLCDALLEAVARGSENVLLLQLDQAPMPEAVHTAIFARNVISVQGRDPDLIAERVLAALPGKKNRLPLLFGAGGAILLVLAFFLFFRDVPGGEPEETGPEAAQEAVYPLPGGITEEDLAKIRCVVIEGGHFLSYGTEEKDPENGWQDILYRTAGEEEEDEGASQWYWNEDGSDLTEADYDLRFLSMLPNLEALCMVRAGMTDAPDLSALPGLTYVSLLDCPIGDLTWLAASPASEVRLRLDTSYDPLTRADSLLRADLTLTGGENDLSAFSPASLKELTLHCEGPGTGGSLSCLSACKKLESIRLYGGAVSDLSFAEGLSDLRSLELSDLPALSDISVLEKGSMLKDLSVRNCPSLEDLSPIHACAGLERISLLPDFDEPVRDISFLEGLQSLNRISLPSLDVPDLDFLKDLSQNSSYLLDLNVGGRVGDWSGLGAFRRIDSLEIDPDDPDVFPQIGPFLADKELHRLVLLNLDQPDLSLIRPFPVELELENCSLTDLSFMPAEWECPDYFTPRLTLNRCRSLTSLSGLEKQTAIGRGKGCLEIENCFFLSDWEALSGMDLETLCITGSFSLPSFASFHAGEVILDTVDGVSDLAFLDGYDASSSCSFKLVGLEGLNNLKALERFHGTYLAVEPPLADQGRDLVNAGNFKELRVEYPRGGWELDNSDLSLTSMEDLETMPDAMLRRVRSLGLACADFFDSGQNDIWEDDDDLLIHNYDTDDTRPAGGEGFLKDLTAFEKLTGLKHLCLWQQPLESLDGIQNFQDLDSVSLGRCPLKDISSLFALQSLRYISLVDCSAESIQGIQNLDGICSLDLAGTDITDLSPLAGCDFDSSLEEGGFELSLLGIRIDDLSPLSAVPVYKSLHLADVDASALVPCLDSCTVLSLQADNCFTGKDADALFSDFAEAHPELEELELFWNQDLTDLSPLLQMENLERVRIGDGMEEARKSLEGKEYSFTLEDD